MMVELLLVEQGWLVVELEWCVGAGAQIFAAVVVAAARGGESSMAPSEL